MTIEITINGKKMPWPSKRDLGWSQQVNEIIHELASTTLQKNGGKFTLDHPLDFGKDHGITLKDLSFKSHPDTKLNLDEQSELSVGGNKLAYKAQLIQDVKDLNALIAGVNTKIDSINTSIANLNTSVSNANTEASNAKRVADDAKSIAHGATNAANNAKRVADDAKSIAHTATNAANTANTNLSNFTKNSAIKKITGTFHRTGDYFSIIGGSENIYGQIYIKVTGRRNTHEVRSYNFLACENMLTCSQIFEYSDVHKGLLVMVERSGNTLIVKQHGSAESDFPHSVSCKVVGWKIDT